MQLYAPDDHLPERKKVNAEFYKGIMDSPLKRIQHPFCSRDFFLLHDNVPAHKGASFCQFLTPQKMLQRFITPRTLQIYLRQTIFCSPR